MLIPPKTILVYCQHLLGVGHLTRSLTLCEYLVKDFVITFIQGGPGNNRTIQHQNFHHHWLPPLLMKENDLTLFDPLNNEDAHVVFLKRQTLLRELVNNTHFDIVLTELFPFGRNNFKEEIISLIKMVRQVNINCKVVSSLRDILVIRTNITEWEMRVVNVANTYYDLILVHGDEKLIPLAKTFSHCERLSMPILHTGYVVKSMPLDGAPLCNRRATNKIVVSTGGSGVADELFLSVAEVAPYLPQYEFHFFIGPLVKPELLTKLQLASSRNPNIQLCKFTNEFTRELLTSCLSISLAGYNTLLDIVNTRTPALVYPYMANNEQMLRAQVFLRMGLFTIMQPCDLVPSRLQELIMNQLESSAVTFDVDLNGGEHTREILIAAINVNSC